MTLPIDLDISEKYIPSIMESPLLKTGIRLTKGVLLTAAAIHTLVLGTYLSLNLPLSPYFSLERYFFRQTPHSTFLSAAALVSTLSISLPTTFILQRSVLNHSFSFFTKALDHLQSR